MPILIAIVSAFLGGFLAKSIEMRNEYGDYFYFLKTSAKANLYRLMYGVLAILFIVLITYTGFVDKSFVPDLSVITGSTADDQANALNGSYLSIILSSFVIGLSSKAILDLPIAKSNNPNETHFKVRDIITFFLPESTTTFNNVIASKQSKYLQTYILKYNNPSVKDLAKRTYDFLDAHPSYQSEDGQRKIDIIMKDLAEMTNSESALRYLYRNLGRETFGSAF